MGDIFCNVIFFQNIVPHQTTGFPFACHIGHPAQFTVAILSILFHLILQVTPIGINDQHAIVTNTFKIFNLVQVHSGLPGPFTHQDFLAILIIELHAVTEIRKRRASSIVYGIPLDGSTHCHLIGLFGSDTFSEFTLGFTSHTEIGSGQIAYCSVSRTI